MPPSMARNEEIEYISHLLTTNEPITAVDYMVESGGVFRFPLALLERLNRTISPQRSALNLTAPTHTTTKLSLVDVCLIEDDYAIQQAVNGALEDENIHVEVCSLGWKAHACIRQCSPKLVILDVNMPDVNGIDLFYLLRADPSTQAIPVLFITANPQRVQRELPNYGAMGAALLPKPFMLDDLLQMVKMEWAVEYVVARQRL